MQNFRQFLFVVFMFLGCLAIHAADDDLITEQVTVTLDEAGTLPDKITSAEKYKITNLKIVGEINGTDLRLIREMAGSNSSGSPTNGKLAFLDLSEAKIVKGGGYYYLFLNHYYRPDNDVVGPCFFYRCCSLTSVTLPPNIISIGQRAFQNCSSLISITIPSSVTSIEMCAFQDCYQLTSVTLSSSITSMRSWAFSGCSSLPSITIPSSVTSVGAWAFCSCSSLTSVYVSWGAPISISTSTFENVNTKSCILYVPKGTYDNYRHTDWGIFDDIIEYDATGIKQVTTSGDAKEISRYSVNGQRLDVPTKGLNIVKYSDGTVKKVVVQ